MEHKSLKLDQQKSDSVSNTKHADLFPPTDIILEVEGTDIHLNKQVLMDNSDVFGAMFENEFREKYEKKIPLPGKNYDDFVEFLRTFYSPSSPPAPITEETILKILPLAHEYNVVSVQHKCTTFLQEACDDKFSTIETSKLVEYLACAEKYRMTTVLPLAIRLCAERNVRLLDKAGLHTGISQETAKQILDTRDKMTEEEVRSSLSQGYHHVANIIKLYWGSCDKHHRKKLEGMLVDACRLASKNSKFTVDDLLDIIIAAERYELKYLLSVATELASKCGFEHIRASPNFDKLSSSRVLDICMKRFDIVDKRPVFNIDDFPGSPEPPTVEDEYGPPMEDIYFQIPANSKLSIEDAYRCPKCE